MLKELHEKAWTWLRVTALQRHDSTDLQTLIDQLAGGVTGEPAIRAATGWPEQRYKNAVRRYATLVRAMPPELSSAVLEAVTRATKSTGNDWRKSKGTEIGSGEDDEAGAEGFEPEWLEESEDQEGDPADELDQCAA